MKTSSDTTTSCKAVPCVGVPLAVVVWAELVMTSLRGWTLESAAIWLKLMGYRLDKAYHCKFTNARNEHNKHEFIIYEFTNEHRHKLELRTDRAVVERNERKDVLPHSLLGGSFCINVGGSPLISSLSSESSELSVALSPTNTKVHTPLSEKRQLLPSGISSDSYYDTNMVLRIQGHPAHCQILKTITFSGDRSLHPSLWDVMILSLVVHNDNLFLGRQCYRFADTIFCSLEKWAAIHKNGGVAPDERGKAKWGWCQASTGSLGAVTVHRRDAEHLDKIWGNFEEKKQAMNQQKEKYERARTEEIETRKRLEEQVEVLVSERAKNKREREERERQLRKAQKERERRHQEEQRMLKQEFAKLRLELQQKDRELQMRM